MAASSHTHIRYVILHRPIVGIDGENFSDHLSELVEVTTTDLANAKCIEVEGEMDLIPLNLGQM